MERPPRRGSSASSSFKDTRRRRWLTACAVVLVVMLLAALPELFTERRGMDPQLIYVALEAPVVIVALSLHYEWAARRQVSTTRTLLASLSLSAGLSAICALAVVHVLLSLGIELDVEEHHLSFDSVLGFGVVSGLLQCALWALGFVYPFAAEDARLRALEAETHKLEAEKLKLEAEKLRGAAELAHLRSQLEPHFLLNTLNAIAGLVTKRPKEARRLLGCLGDLLRDSLRDPEEMQTLREEIAWLRRYAEILESRHSGALQFHWEVSDDALGVLVPRLLLQPLVENAINHGALQRSGDGEVTIRITAERAADVGAEYVVCAIEDNGPGVPDQEPRSGAFGLRSVRRRLELKYGDANLQLESTARGTRAVVRLPRQEVRETSAIRELS